jgi:protocatechuate 3,4-dioxygenase beta subunit
MRHLTSGVFATALFLSCLQFETANAQTKPASKTDTGSVSGRVTVKGKPLPGIIVALSRGESGTRTKPILKSTTDEDGKYRITNVPAGTYHVTPMASTFVFYDSSRGGGFGKDLLIADGEAIEGLDFAMIRGGVITGRITDSEGRPVVEEFVHLETLDQSIPLPPGAEAVQSDDRGIYRAFGVPPGKYWVSAGLGETGFGGGARSRPSYRRTFYPGTTEQKQAKIVDVTEGSEANEINIALARMAKGVSVSGRVVDSQNGEPVGNVRVYFTKIIVQEHLTANSGGPILRSNDEGEFKAEGLTPGTYRLSLNDQSLNVRADPVTFEVFDEDVTGLLIKTMMGATLGGVLVIENSSQTGAAKKFPELFVVAFTRDDSPYGGSTRYSPVKPDGTFYITGLPAGTLKFSLGWSHDGEGRNLVISRIEREGVIQPDGLQIRDGEQVTGLRVIAIEGTGSIRGSIKIENGSLEPDARVYVSLMNSGNPLNRPPPTVDARGRFLVGGLISGTYEVYASVHLPRSNQTLTSGKHTVNVTEGVVSEVMLTVDVKQAPKPIR